MLLHTSFPLHLIDACIGVIFVEGWMVFFHFPSTFDSSSIQFAFPFLKTGF